MPSPIKAVHLSSNPIIRPRMPGIMGHLGININGPSLIRVPDWIENPLGRYYLYFAHHLGKYIRLAYADHLAGPWNIYEPGTLHLDRTACQDHIASPDVHVDEEAKEIWMYFHGCYQKRHRDNQITMLAKSKDGLNFTSSPEILGPNYFRVFRYNGFYYAIANNWYNTVINNRPVAGILLRSKDGETAFELGLDFIPNLRHAAVWVQGDKLTVFYSRYGDAPERILMSCVDLTQDWHNWTISEPVTVIDPEMDYEGGALSIFPSEVGVAEGVMRQLRDPAIYTEEEKLYLLYSVAGEQGIAIAELIKNDL
ncbi:MAG: hypothetical protein F6K53_43035 [Moorea sp. SIO4A1]|nr:hypothetical protein [Moorena sp. SIO4A3]NEQ63715.1 hypothetical protein [Moorena sp. SIO4A1]